MWCSVPIGGLQRAVVKALQLRPHDVGTTCGRCTSSWIRPRPKAHAGSVGANGARASSSSMLESPYRSLMEPLLEYIEQVQRSDPHGYVTVILPGVRAASPVAAPAAQPARAADQGRAALQAQRRGHERALPSGPSAPNDAGAIEDDAAFAAQDGRLIAWSRALAVTRTPPSHVRDTTPTRRRADHQELGDLVRVQLVEPRLERRDPIAGRLDHELLLARPPRRCPSTDRPTSSPAGRSRRRRGARRRGRAQTRRHRSSRQASSGRSPERRSAAELTIPLVLGTGF